MSCESRGCLATTEANQYKWSVACPRSCSARCVVDAIAGAAEVDVSREMDIGCWVVTVGSIIEQCEAVTVGDKAEVFGTDLRSAGDSVGGGVLAWERRLASCR